jgi:glycosyltransferase involved in cell wall biosynthesis
MSETLISVALCTYNGSGFLEEQLQSILDQTYKNLEIIIVDDCSTDNTLVIAHKYAEDDKRIKVFSNEKNLGFNKNFERALSLTAGKMVAISDQDDIWELEKIEKLKSNIGDNWLIFSNSALIYPNGTLKEGRLLDKFKYESQNFRSLLLSNFVTGHTCLMKREFIDRILPFPQQGYYDWWMGFIALYHNKLTYLPQMLTRYRVHETSVTQIEFNDESSHRIFFEHTLVMLDSFITYKDLKENDRRFIKRLRTAYRKKLASGFNPWLTLAVGKYYSDFFPNLKKRTTLSAYNFARRFSRKLK